MPQKRDSNGRFAKESQGTNGPINNQATMLAHDYALNALQSRRELIKKLTDPRRDIDDECGYVATEEISPEQYRDMYDREGIASRVVNVLPEETWKTQPTVFEDEDPNNETEFEGAWRSLGNNLQGGGWYKDEQGGPIWEILRRIDRLSGIGHYGVLLLGIDDGSDLEEPIDGVQPDGTFNVQREHKLLFVRAFDQYLAEISSFETDTSSPRFGQPLFYNIYFGDPRTFQHGVGQPTNAKRVHWSRVLHVADNLDSSEVFGIPRMRPVFNRLYDLRKLYGGAAEMYWRGAFFGLSIETHPTLGGDVDLPVDEIKDQMEQYMNGLQRFMAMGGVSVKSLAPQVVDPSPQIDKAIEAICIQKAIPKRVFMGSERGELASSQDADTWNDRLRDRRHIYVTPRLIVPFVNRLIFLRILPEPKEGYSVRWPDLDTASETEQAQVAELRTKSMATYVQGGVDNLMEPMDYLTRELGYTEDEAEQILENAIQRIQDEEQTSLRMADQPQEDEDDNEHLPGNSQSEEDEGASGQGGGQS